MCRSEAISKPKGCWVHVYAFTKALGKWNQRWIINYSYDSKPTSILFYTFPSRPLALPTAYVAKTSWHFIVNGIYSNNKCISKCHYVSTKTVKSGSFTPSATFLWYCHKTTNLQFRESSTLRRCMQYTAASTTQLLSMIVMNLHRKLKLFQ